MRLKHRLRNLVENLILRQLEPFFTKKHVALTLHLHSKLFFIQKGANVSDVLFKQGIISFYRIINGKKEMKRNYGSH